MSKNLSYDLLVGTILTPVVIADYQMIILETNSAACDIFGYDSEELIGHSVKMLMPEKTQAIHDEYVNNYLEGREPKIIGIPSRQVVGTTKLGKKLHLLLSLAENKESRVFIASFQDVTELLEQKQAIREIERRKDAEAIHFLAHLLKNRFINISTLISSASVEALRSSNDSDKALLEEIEEEAQLGLKVCTLQQIAQQIVYDEYLPLIRWMKVRETLQELCRSHFQCVVASDVPQKVHTDENVLFHILDRFIYNATKASGSKFTPRLDVSNDIIKKEISFVVTSALSEELRLHAGKTEQPFMGNDIFKTSDVSGRTSSLYAIKKCAELIHGKVKLLLLDSHMEAILTLKIDQVPADPVKTELPVVLTENTVLAALDDDRISRTMYRRLFKKLGVHPKSLDMIHGESKSEIADFASWILKLQAEGKEPDIVLLDQNLDAPNTFRKFMEGSVVAGDLKKGGFRGKIVICSANDAASDVSGYIQAGADGFINKSQMTPKRFTEKITAILGDSTPKT